MNIKQQILNYILKSKNSLVKNYAEKKIGLEIEHFVLDQNNQSVFYNYEDSSKAGVMQILQKLAPKFKQIDFAHYKGQEYLIGLKRDDVEISLEPGAQLEVSILATDKLAKMQEAYNGFINDIKPILDLWNYHLEYTGYRPDKAALEVPIIPKNRYFCMDAHFKNVDVAGVCMMRNTASVQLSLDFYDKEDFVKKFRLAAFLTPLIYFLYDNVSVFEKSNISKSTFSHNIRSKFPDVGTSMIRNFIWNNTDNDRCGLHKSFFDSNFDAGVYVKNLLKTPLLYAPYTCKNLINKKFAINLDQDAYYPNAKVTDIIDGDINLSNEDIQHIMSMCFFDVRVKNFLEIRAADCMPFEYALSYAAFIKGIFYSAECLDSALALFEGFGYQDFENANTELKKYGWFAEVYGFNVFDILKKLAALSKKGLDKSEQAYLVPTESLINTKKCLKDVASQESINNYEDKAQDILMPVSNTHENIIFQRDYFLKHQGCVENRQEIYNNHLTSDAIFEDRVVDTAYFPKVYAQDSLLQFGDIVKTSYGIWEKIMDEYFANSSFAQLYDWDDFSAKLINFRPKYSSAVPISRIDIFYSAQTGAFDICEFNTGGTAAQSEVSCLTKDIERAEPFIALKNEKAKNGISLNKWELYESWVKKFVSIYDEWADNTNHPLSQKNSDDFNIAIVDFLENSQMLDFQIFKSTFESLGYNCYICDIRDLKFDGKNLMTADDVIIHAIYKRATLNDVLPMKDDHGLRNMIDAVFADEVCPIDWFNTQIIHDKQISFILRNPLCQKLLSPAQISFVENHIPFAAKLNLTNWKNQDFINKQHNYIVKPLNGRRSKDVYSGRDCSPSDWPQILEKCAKANNFIIQEFCDQYTSPNIEISQDNNEFLNKDYSSIIQQFANMEGLYCYDGNFAGIWLRQGNHAKNSTTYNVTTPTFFETSFNTQS